MKVGQWYFKWNEKQQEAFKKYASREKYFDLQSTRKFITAAFKKFGEAVIYKGNGVVEVNGDLYYYSHDRNSFHALDRK